ncbi:MAG: tetratricopeptide repeat protein, partial [Boseongicola sp. SB0662_bin_57]|nr:tetratricopeptide repeat protein [Boseongicola sp. SB0662_bin_57]
MVAGETDMKQGFLQSSRYSPGNMSREALEALFVGRDGIMEDVLSRLMKSVQGPEKHFLLLVGPRGSGKTHFIALAHYRLMERLGDADVRNEVLVAELKEEEWGVASFLDLVVRILKALADQIPSLSTRIDTIYERFSKDPDEAEAYAIGLLREHAQGKTLMLFCENLLDLFGGLGDEGQRKWRSVMQEDGNWTMVASTPSMFAALTLQDNPFYGFFTIRPLERLDFETALELLAKKAAHESRPELAGFLRTPLGRARARAIHHLAVGNHRTYVVLFDFLDKESLDDLTTPLMQMVDDLTPYYRDRMRQLSPTQRKIVDFLSQQDVPATIKDIAVPSLMSHQTAAKQIGELESAGFVRRTRIGRNAFCELSEPLMRICMEVKDNRTEHFRLFVEFLRHWFTTSELEQRRSVFRHGDQAARLDRAHVEEALRRSYTDRKQPFRDALREEADRCLAADDYDGLATIQETLASDGGPADDHVAWIYALIEKGDLDAALKVGRDAAAKFPDHAAFRYLTASAYRLRREFDEALNAIDRAIDLDERRPGSIWLRANILMDLERFDEALDAAQAVLDADPDHLHSHEQIMRKLASLGRPHDAGALARKLVKHAPGNLRAMLIASRFYLDLDRFDEAMQLLQRALEIDSDNQEARLLRGQVLFQMSDYRRASEDLRFYASHNPDSMEAHWRLADSLLYSGAWEEAVDVAEHLIDLDPEHFHACRVLGNALVELDRPEDAVAAFDKLLPTEDCEGLLIAASSVRVIGDCASAKRYLGRVAELQPDNRDLWMEATRINILEGSFDAATESAARIEALPGCSLLGRLFAAQAAAATMPLHLALDALGTAFRTEDFMRDDQLHVEATTEILAVSVRSFGPRFLPEGLAKLRSQLGTLADDGM